MFTFTFNHAFSYECEHINLSLTILAFQNPKCPLHILQLFTRNPIQSRNRLIYFPLYFLQFLPRLQIVGKLQATNRNLLFPIGSNLSFGGSPFGHGASPCSSIHFPILAFRSSVQPLQNEADNLTSNNQ